MYTSHGLYIYVNESLEVNRWFRLTMVYNPESATDDSKVNKVFIDNKMNKMVHINENYGQGTGQMVLGRSWVNWNQEYGAVLIDDLKMWNRKLSDKEIVATSN